MVKLFVCKIKIILTIIERFTELYAGKIRSVLFESVITTLLLLFVIVFN